MHPLLRCAVVASVTLSFLASGCARRADDSRRAVLDTYARIVAATYEDSIAAAHALDAAIDALLENPTEDTLSAARERWKQARIPYGYSEAFRFYAGPIDGEGGLEGRVNGWPLDENHIDAVRADRYDAAPGANIVGDPASFPEITPELIAQQNGAGGEKNIASGYHAIEFLLWGQDLNDPPDSAGRRSHRDYIAAEGSPDSVNARRGRYLKAATTLLILDLQSVAAQWREASQDEKSGDENSGASNYRTAMVTGDVYTGLKRMLTGMTALAEVEMAGERMSAPLLSGDQEEEQSCFSDTSAEDLRANAAGIEHVYYARYTRPDGSIISGPSLADLLRAADPRIAQEMDARLARTREALASIRSPFDREIQPDNAEGRARVQAAIDALHAQALSTTRAAQALQIFLSPIESDGD